MYTDLCELQAHTQTSLTEGFERHAIALDLDMRIDMCTVLNGHVYRHVQGI